MKIQVITQAMINICVRFAASLFANFKVSGQEHALAARSAEQVIVIVNHRSRFDAFLSGCVLSLREVLPFCPIYFMTHAKYMVRPIVGRILWAFGSYSVEPKSGTVAQILQSTVDLIEEKKNIIMFPEGKLIVDEAQRRAKPGIAFLARKFPNLKIMPIKLSGTGQVSFFRFFTFQNKISATVGPAFCYNDCKKNWDKVTDDRDLAQKIMERVWEL